MNRRTNPIHISPRTVLRRAVCLTLCLLLACGVSLFALQQSEPLPVEAARTSKNVDDDIVECEALLSRLQSDLKSLNEQISELDGASNAALEQAQLAAGQVTVLSAQIELNESLLQSCEMKIGTAQAERVLAESDYEYYQDVLAEVIRYVDEHAPVSDFELLFTSASLSDYLNRRDDLDSVMECVDDLRQSMQQSLLRLDELEAEYTEAEEKYEKYLAQLDEQKAELEKSKAEFERLAAEAGQQQSELSGEYASLNKTIQETQAKIASLKKERATLIALEEEQRRKEEQEKYKPGTVSDLGFAWPLQPNATYRITSYFSTRTNPITGHGTEFHEGLDIACAKGTQILAAKAGVVTKSAEYGGYGKCVILYHGKDSKGRSVTTLYGHASELKCVEGQQVEQGQCISLVGSTGRSTGNHLHFSVLLDGEYVDPDDYLPNGYYIKMENAGY